MTFILFEIVDVYLMCSTYHHMDLKREFDDLIIFGLGFESLFELVWSYFLCQLKVYN